jgi:hypothetical protein
MSAEDQNVIEGQRQALLGQIRNAETALRESMNHTRGFGETARAHLERALAHVQETYIAINESKPVRTVPQLLDDLNRLQQVKDDSQRRHGKPQRI